MDSQYRHNCYATHYISGGARTVVDWPDDGPDKRIWFRLSGFGCIQNRNQQPSNSFARIGGMPCGRSRIYRFTHRLSDHTIYFARAGLDGEYRGDYKPMMLQNSGKHGLRYR